MRARSERDLRVEENRHPVRDLLGRLVNSGLAPGAVAGWGSPPSGLRMVAAGKAVLQPELEEVSEDTWFDLASLTKPLVTATLCLLAFRSGVLRLASTVGEVLDEVRGTAISGLTVHELLTHTTGLPAWLPLYCLAEGTPEVLPTRLGTVRLEAPPGTRVIYTCIGFVILGLMLERVSDVGLEPLFQGEVLEELGLENRLGFHPDPAIRLLAGGASRPTVEERLAREAGFDAGFVPASAAGLPDDGNARFLDGVAGNAGLFGTAAGAISLAAEYLPGGGRLLTKEEAAHATSDHTAGLDQARGLGWQLAATPGCSAGPSLSPQAFGHNGFTGVSVWVDPARREAYALLTNRAHPGHRESDLHPLRRRFHTLASNPHI